MFFIGVVPFGITTSNWVPIFLHLLILIFYYKGFIFFCWYVCMCACEYRRLWRSEKGIGGFQPLEWALRTKLVYCNSSKHFIAELSLQLCLFCSLTEAVYSIVKRCNTSIHLFPAVAFLFWRSVYENLLPLKVYCLNLLLNCIGTLE